MIAVAKEQLKVTGPRALCFEAIHGQWRNPHIGIRVGRLVQWRCFLDSFSHLLLLAVTSNLLVLGWTSCIKSMNLDCGFPKDEYNLVGLPLEYTKANSSSLYWQLVTSNRFLVNWSSSHQCFSPSGSEPEKGWRFLVSMKNNSENVAGTQYPNKHLSQRGWPLGYLILMSWEISEKFNLSFICALTSNAEALEYL